MRSTSCSVAASGDGSVKLWDVALGEANNELLKLIHKRAVNHSVEISIYIKDMFATGHDEANRETVSSHETDTLPLVGLALREERKIVDKITKGAKLHS